MLSSMMIDDVAPSLFHNYDTLYLFLEMYELMYDFICILDFGKILQKRSESAFSCWHDRLMVPSSENSSSNDPVTTTVSDSITC